MSEPPSKSFPGCTLPTTESAGIVSANMELLNKLLPRLEKWANRPVAVVPRANVQKVFQGTKYLHEVKNAWKRLQAKVEFRPRVEAEADDTLVQLVACGIPVHSGKVLVLRRGANDEKAKSYGKTILWKGCHLAQQQGMDCDLAFVADSLQKRLQNELHLKIEFDLDLRGLVWNEDADESQHLGLMFFAKIEDDVVAKSMHDKEFRKSARGHKLTGTFQTQTDVLEALDSLDLEPWSRLMVSNVKV